MQAQRRELGDGRWHFQHGPIDLIIAADGEPESVSAAHSRCWARFGGVLPELVQELALLREPLRRDVAQKDCPCRGRIAQRMWEAAWPYRCQYVTPMVAVAGSVAAELISCYRHPGIRRALINNGGDIAFHLTPGESYRVAVCAEPEATLAGRKSWDAWLDLKAEGAIRGIATSGWRGRSFSLGIADAVTVLAADAGVADAAATMVANAVDVASPQVVRQPAASLKDDSDLGELLVTVEVKPLTQAEVAEALNRGLECASRLQNCGTIAGAALFLQGERRGLGAMRLHLADGADRRVAPHGDPILDGVT